MTLFKTALGNAFLGLLLLSVSIAIIGKWFPKVSSEVSTPILYAGGFLFVGLVAFGGAKADGTALTYPSIWGAIALAICGAMLGYGDYFSIRSLNMGGSVLLVATVIALVPVVSGIFVLILGADMPSARQWIAVAFAIISAAIFRSDPTLHQAPETQAQEEKP